MMMITRRKAVPQVIGFLAMENGLFFAATSATYGMPMVVELGIALDVLVGTFIFGIFFFQIRETFDSLDIQAHGKAERRLTWKFSGYSASPARRPVAGLFGGRRYAPGTQLGYQLRAPWSLPAS